jgi:C4-type Zn-finger protein
VLVWLFILAAIGVSLMVMFGSMDAHVMPFGCPACHHSSDRGVIGPSIPWYKQVAAETVRCRYCGAQFREHPNGSLVRE